ncbi:hypothetical protein BC943DRAFT_319548 [Umbelopsis sp. AD052]|nr:hypothetical protein BC943DRAFT_319548 [Umbelopsis sp. AD052]
MDASNKASNFWLSCNAAGENCHCDWRLTYVSCEESYAIDIIFKINVVWSAIVSLLAAALLIHRIFCQGQRLYDMKRGYLRPQPVETLLVLAVIYNILRMVHSIVILGDNPNSVIFRSFIFEFGWQFGFAALAAYLWGIAITVFDSEAVMDNGWQLSQRHISRVGLAFVLSPVITNNVCSILSGFYAQQGDAYKADIFARLLYAFWAFYCILLVFCVSYSGMRLMHLLGTHLSMLGSGRRYEQVKTGRMKVRAIMTVSGLCLACFTMLCGIYSICRTTVQNHKSFNILWAVLWNFAGPSASILIEVALFIDPRMFGGPSFSVSGSSNERKKEMPGFASSITTDRHKSGIPLSWINTQDEYKRSSAQSSNIYANSTVSDSTLLIHQAP